MRDQPVTKTDGQGREIILNRKAHERAQRRQAARRAGTVRVRSEWLDRSPGDRIARVKQPGRRFGPAPKVWRSGEPTAPLSNWARLAHYTLQTRSTEPTLRQQRRIMHKGRAAGLSMRRYPIGKKPGYGVMLATTDSAVMEQQTAERQAAGV